MKCIEIGDLRTEFVSKLDLRKIQELALMTHPNQIFNGKYLLTKTRLATVIANPEVPEKDAITMALDIAAADLNKELVAKPIQTLGIYKATLLKGTEPTDDPSYPVGDYMDRDFKWQKGPVKTRYVLKFCYAIMEQ